MTLLTLTFYWKTNDGLCIGSVAIGQVVGFYKAVKIERNFYYSKLQLKSLIPIKPLATYEKLSLKSLNLLMAFTLRPVYPRGELVPV
jgi:hypothetical protein